MCRPRSCSPEPRGPNGQQSRCGAHSLWTLEVSFWNPRHVPKKPMLEARVSAARRVYVQAHSSRKSRVGALFGRQPSRLLSRASCVGERCSHAMARRTTHNRVSTSSKGLLCFSSQNSTGAIAHRFGPHFRVHSLEWHSRVQHGSARAFEISRTQTPAYPRVRNAVAPFRSA